MLLSGKKQRAVRAILGSALGGVLLYISGCSGGGSGAAEPHLRRQLSH